MTPILLTYAHPKGTLVLNPAHVGAVTPMIDVSAASLKKLGSPKAVVQMSHGNEHLVLETPLQIYAKLTEALGPKPSAEDPDADDDIIHCPECDEEDDLELLSEDAESRAFRCGNCRETWFEEWPEEEEEEEA